MIEHLLLVFTSVLFMVDPFALERRLGQTGMRILTRFMGLVLLTIAIQFVLDGFRQSGVAAS